MNVLFVCRANTGRSQIAEAFFNKLSLPAHRAKSAGTLVDHKEQVRISDKTGTEALRRSMNDVGIDIGENERKEVTPQMIDAADKIIVMAEPETIPDYLKNSNKVAYWNVPDAKDMPYETICEIRDAIEKRVQMLLKELRN